MISLSAAVNVILWLIVAAVVFGLLWWLLGKIGARISGDAGQLFINIGQIILLVLAVLVVIGILLQVVGGQPIFRP